jgi:hypothetical protein
MNELYRMTKSELIAEIRKLKGEPEPNFEELYGRVDVARRPKKEKPIFAGMNLKKDDLLVVDETKRLAYVYPEVKTVPNKIRIHGYAARSFKKGETVRIRHWLTYDPV